MTITRSLALAATAAAGLVGLAQPASAAAGSDYEVWRSNYGTGTASASADFNVWRSHYGTTTPASSASFDADGDVDGADYLIWQRG